MQKIIVFISSIVILLSFSSFLLAQFGTYGQWHPEITVRPRLLLLDTEKNEIQNRLGNGVFQNLYNNNY